MLIRAIALSLALMIGLGTIIPLATETTEAGPHKHRKYKRHHHKHYKKYSKAWWRQYHARQRRKRALAARRRALRLRQLRLAKARQTSDTGNKADKKSAKNVPIKAEDTTVALLPSGDAAPKGWKRSAATGGELQFRVDNNSGAQIGSAAISVVGPSMGETGDRGRTHFLAGVPTTSLRRDVINRMIRENGWVVNDYQKEIGGKNVYIVVAQSPAFGGRLQSRMFYFTEADGRIYSVTTNSSTDEAERLAEESEKVINSLQNRPRPMQQAAVKE
jgi:hypothetical protein